MQVLHINKYEAMNEYMNICNETISICWCSQTLQTELATPLCTNNESLWVQW